jgi:glycosyltransferase involved in cell wall biosynthesis
MLVLGSSGPRVVVLWSALTGYVRAELATLAEQGADLLVFHSTPTGDAAFAPDPRGRELRCHAWSGAPDEVEVEDMVATFEPDVLMVISWHIGAYRRIARRWRGRALRVLVMDNQWWGTPKQWGGVAISPWVIRPAYDCALVAGDRQADFARRLGFRSEQLVWGMNTCDYPRFAQVATDRKGDDPPDAFLYVGRLSSEKAIDVLAEGYRRYRDRAVTPWPLLVAGTGPEAHHVEGVEGVELLGSVRPDAMPEVFARAGCLVLPSRFEQWGVAIHEATAAGLPVVCTWVCGASTRLVLDGYNGVVISPDDPDALAEALGRIASASADERRAMGEASSLLARQYSPDRWAANLLQRIPDLRVRAGLDPEPWAAEKV